MKNVKIILLILAVLSISLSGEVSAQTPCDNVTQHLESEGIISGSYTKVNEGSLTIGGIPLTLITLKNETMKNRYYVNCISGEVYTYDELPGYQLSDPVLSKIDRQIRFQAKIRSNESKFRIVVGYFTPTEEKKEILEGLGMEMDERANELTYNQSLEYGIDFYNKLAGYATNDTIHRIAELDFVTRITLDEPVRAAGATPGPQIILIANSIDYSLATDFIDYRKKTGIAMTRITALDFEQRKGERFIVILGGPDAPERVGEIVQQILSKEEQDSVRVQGSKRLFIKKDVWADGQTVFIIAGSDRHQTKLASSENQEPIKENVREMY